MAYWFDAPSPQDNDSVLEDMRAAGAPDEALAQFAKQRQQQERFEVLPQNWSALEWFLSVSNLWRWRSPILCDGMDWLQVEAESRLSQTTRSAEDFAKLKLMANHAKHLINEQLNE